MSTAHCELLCAGFVCAAERPGRQLSRLRDTDLYSLRLDHNLNTNNRLTLRASVSPSDSTGIQVQAQGPQNFGQNSFSRTSEQTYHDWNVAGQDTWTIGTNKVNELRFQYARRGLPYYFSRAAGGSNVAVNIPGFAFFGREPFSFVQRTEQRYQFTDNFSWVKGAHTIKFGVDGNFIPIVANFTVNFGGIYNFGSAEPGFYNPAIAPPAGNPFPAFSPIQAYGAGIPSNFIQGVGNPHDSFSNTTAAGFLQDSWRIASGLTLNYGVRYDVEFTPSSGRSTGFRRPRRIRWASPREFRGTSIILRRVSAWPGTRRKMARLWSALPMECSTTIRCSVWLLIPTWPMARRRHNWC